MMQLQDLLDAGRADDLVTARVRERWLRHQATEDATFVGTLLDLAEHTAPLSLSLVGGRRHDGRVVGLAADAVVVDERGEHVVIRLGAVVFVRPAPGTVTAVASGDRAASLELAFGELLARVAPDQPDVAVSFVSGDAVTGRLLAVGVDVMTVQVSAGDAGLVYCPLPSVASVRLRSG